MNWQEHLTPLRTPLTRVKRRFKARLSKNSRDNKKPSSKHSFTNWISRRSRDRLRSSKMKILRERLLWLRGRDNKRKCCREPEPLSLRSFKRKRLLRSLRLREWSRSSLPLRLCKRPKLQLPRRLPPRLTLLDSRESTSSPEERPRLNSKCSRLSSRWRPSKLSNSKNKDLWRIRPTLRNKSNLWKSSKLKPTSKLNKMQPSELRRKPLKERSPKRRNSLSRKLLMKKPRSKNKREKKKPKRELRNRELLKKRKRSKSR